MRKICLISILLILPLFIWAQNGKKKQKKVKKLPENIEAIDYNFSLRPAYSRQSTWLEIVDKSKTNDKIIYRPNVLGSAGGKIKIKGITASYMHRLPSSEENTNKYGTTEYQNIDINIQTRIVGFNVYYINYDGFYLKTPETYFSTWDTTGYYPKHDDLQVFSAGFKMHFVFTKSFSINAAFSQSERQKKSAGSFMLMISDRYTQYRSDDLLYPPSHIPNYTSRSLTRNFEKGRGVFNTTYIAYGLGYSIIKGKFNLTPILLSGVGVQVQLFNNKTNTSLSLMQDNRGLRLPWYFNYKTALGYNGDHFFFLLINSLELERISFKDVRFNTYFFNLEGSIGFRF